MWIELLASKPLLDRGQKKITLKVNKLKFDFFPDDDKWILQSKNVSGKNIQNLCEFLCFYKRLTNKKLLKLNTFMKSHKI